MSQSNSFFTHNVDTKAANEYGIFDTSGEVFECCWDTHDKSYYRKSPENDPKGADYCIIQICRLEEY
ncbi:MAG TPA: SUMF1/EgtB/PvdO family nonheme iron enzyme [Candidatus Cloacimonadota bacterium]|nr:SUMF1/EgtB/PvdO family nonheme iron enzyme [Candidatus Cloacimonadota bacterium]HQB40926.1 SUMF1/EgtB/PvdO family nonheme iron enzyme [Candidatus Cloacimonadota bacterium]